VLLILLAYLGGVLTVLSPCILPVHFLIHIDGAPPGEAHGSDVAPDGSGVVTDERLYELVRKKASVTDRTFEIEFLDPGVPAYSFPFG
jgi:Thioredoxin like C-terminal domain